MLSVKKCSNLSGGKYFPITVNIFPLLKIWNYDFCCTAFIDKIIRGNIIYDVFYQLVVNMEKYLSQKGKVRENECHKAQVIFADLSLLWQIFPHINHKLMK